jgi:hypothetical protein
MKERSYASHDILDSFLSAFWRFSSVRNAWHIPGLSPPFACFAANNLAGGFQILVSKKFWPQTQPFKHDKHMRGGDVLHVTNRLTLA